MDRVYLDSNIFVIHNFISVKEKELLIEMDVVTQDAIKARLSLLFNNTFSVFGSGGVRTVGLDDKILPHADQHEDGCLCGVNHQDTWAVSAAIYLNKDYTGGTIHYINQDIYYDPKELDLLVHPASEEYRHEAFTITAGFKKLILFFMG